MKRLLFLLLTGLFAQLLISCYPEGADKVEDMDVAITNYDKNANFADFSTFSMPDSIVYFVNKANELSGDHQFDSVILALVSKNFTDRGYTKIEGSETNKPDFLVTVSAFSNVNYYYVNDNWNDYWGWYPGWDWYGWNWPNGIFSPYYPWWPVSVYSYRSGSIVIEMFDTQNVNTTSGKLPVIWTGIADGILSGSSASIQNRAEKEINQAFKQSPYLMK